MRRSPFAAAALLLLAAGSASAQFPGSVAPLPFTPYVPPVSCAGRVGRDYINCAIPDIRVLAGASYRYTVKVRWLDKGREREQKVQVPVQAGDHPTVVLLTPVSR